MKKEKDIGELLLEVFVSHKLSLIKGIPNSKKKIKFLSNTKLRSNLNLNEYKEIERITEKLIKLRKDKTKKEYTDYIAGQKKIYNEYMKTDFSEDFVKELEEQRKQDIAKEKEKEKNGKDTVK